MVIILCGAGGDGGYRITFYKQFFAQSHIYAIEAEEANFNALYEVYGTDKRITLIHKAVWIEDGTKKLCIGSSSSAHSLYLKSYAKMSEDKFQMVETLDLAKFIDQFDKVEFIRMNIEGAEYEVLRHCFDSGVMDKVVELQVELHARKMEQVRPLDSEVRKKLEEWGKTHRFKELR